MTYPAVPPGHSNDPGLVAATGRAAAVLETVREVLREAFPQQWRSRAADGYGARLLDALVHTGRAVDAVEEAHARAISCVEAAELARQDES